MTYPFSFIEKSNNRTTFKSTYQILKEISEVYDDLADVDQANLTELLAGKHTYQNVQKCA